MKWYLERVLFTVILLGWHVPLILMGYGRPGATVGGLLMFYLMILAPVALLLWAVRLMRDDAD